MILQVGVTNLTLTDVREKAVTPAATKAGGPRSRRSLVVPVALQLAAMLGLGALLYPSASNWFGQLAHGGQIAGYSRQVAATPTDQLEAAREAAAAYNQDVPVGALRDPYTNAQGAAAEESEYGRYESLLQVGDSNSIGQLAYPGLGISLPIYHGTADETLLKGAGHLYGSSLPVGGPSSHAVLTSHSGQTHSPLFTPLTKAQIGDTFSLNVLGRQLSYQVDQVMTVTPEDTSELAIIPGQDHVTLITCTPLGINSHRLLVRGVRTAAPLTDDQVTVAVSEGAGFPWWAMWFTLGSAAVAGILFTPSRTGRELTGETEKP